MLCSTFVGILTSIDRIDTVTASAITFNLVFILIDSAVENFDFEKKSICTVYIEIMDFIDFSKIYRMIRSRLNKLVKIN